MTSDTIKNCSQRSGFLKEIEAEDSKGIIHSIQLLDMTECELQALTEIDKNIP